MVDTDGFQALVLDYGGVGPMPSLRMVSESDIPAGDVIVAVEYFTLNYKDGMVKNGLGKLVRKYLHVGGITLQFILAGLRSWACCASVSLAANPQFTSTVLSLVMRWITMRGADSATCPKE